MKFSSLFFLSLLAVFAFSCDDEEDILTPMSSAIDGTWKATSFSAAISSSTTGTNGSSSGSTSVDAPEADFTLEFDDGTWTATGAYSIALTTSTDGGSGNASAVVSTSTGSTNTGTFTADDNTISVQNSFVNLTINDNMIGGANGTAQVMDYSIIGDVLTITQDQETTTVEGSNTTTSTVVSTSVYTRQ